MYMHMVHVVNKYYAAFIHLHAQSRVCTEYTHHFINCSDVDDLQKLLREVNEIFLISSASNIDYPILLNTQ